MTATVPTPERRSAPATAAGPENEPSSASSTTAASRRPPLDHPVRKALYTLTGVRQHLNVVALDVETLIGELRRADTDPETWDEVVQLRRDLRVAGAQLDTASRAAQMWSRKAARDA